MLSTYLAAQQVQHQARALQRALVQQQRVQVAWWSRRASRGRHGLPSWTQFTKRSGAARPSGGNGQMECATPFSRLRQLLPATSW